MPAAFHQALVQGWNVKFRIYTFNYDGWIDNGDFGDDRRSEMSSSPSLIVRDAHREKFLTGTYNLKFF